MRERGRGVLKSSPFSPLSQCLATLRVPRQTVKLHFENSHLFFQKQPDSSTLIPDLINYVFRVTFSNTYVFLYIGVSFWLGKLPF